MILHPVVGRVPRGLSGRAGVQEARRIGKLALEESARLARFEGEARFPRDAERAPVAVRPPGGATWHWSTTNTPGLAAGVVAPARVGVDAEWLDRPRIEAALEYFDAEELALLDRDERTGVLGLWSAKEAILKLTGVGMAGMGRVRLEGVLPRDGAKDDRLVLSFRDEVLQVAQLWQGEHVLSVACDADAFDVRCTVLAEATA
jgi:hypothetical protein